MSYKHIPSEITSLPQWVCVWDGSKIPMRATEKKGASSVNPKTWSDFDTAVMAVEAGLYDNVGFVFNDNGIIGIDIDCGFDDDGFLSDTSIDIMRACKSYTEKSRSGRGVHILLRGDIPFKGKNNGKGVEIYKSSRYFIVTGDKLIYDHIIENQEAIDYVLGKYFSEPDREPVEDDLPNPNRIYSPVYLKPTNGKIVLRPYYPPIPDGMRNISLTSLAGQMHSQGYPKKDIYQELLHVNQIACSPPLSVSEIQLIVNSISKYRR